MSAIAQDRAAAARSESGRLPANYRIPMAAALAIERIANALLRDLAFLLWPRKRPRSAARVCVYRIGNIGDMVCALPAIHAIRRAYPEAHLTLLTSPGLRGAAWTGELLEDLGWFDAIDVYHAEDIAGWRKLFAMARRLRARRFDVWIELPPALAPFRVMLRNLLLAGGTGVRWAGGWELATVRTGRQAQSESREFDDEVVRLLKITAALGIDGDDAAFPLALPARHHRRAEEILSTANLAGRRLIAIAPGAKRPTNRWPTERFIEVARRFAARGFGIAIIGGASERELCARVETGAGGDLAVNLAGRCSVPESCAVLARCDLLICNDSGVQHLAAAMGTRCVSIFAARDLGLRWRPHGSGHVAIRKWVPCHTCLLEVCPYDNRCVGLITVDEVAAAAERILRSASEPGSDGACASHTESEIRLRSA